METNETEINVVENTPVVDESPAPPSAPESTGETEIPEVPAYTPNLKFKATFYDPEKGLTAAEQRELEMDKEIAGVIKDAETEEKFRKLYAKAHGLDFYEAKHKHLEQNFHSFSAGFNKLGQMVQSGKLQDFMDFWKIPKQALYEHVKAQLQFDELPPEEKARIAEQNQARIAAQTSDARYNEVVQMFQAERKAARTRELDQTLSRPDVSAVAAEYDAMKNQPGAFRLRVINEGRMAFLDQKKDISADEAVREVMWGLGYRETDGAQNQGNLPTVSPVAQKKLPTLPNVGTGRTSPVSKSVKSTADLRALAKQMQET